MKDIQYEQLKKEVTADISNRDLMDSAFDFDAIPCISSYAEIFKTNIYENDLNKIKTESKLIPYTEITGNPILKGIKTLVKKLTNFFVRPLVDHQGDLNDHYAELFAMTLGKLQAETQKREQMELELKEANARIDKLEQMLKMVENDT